MVLWVARLLIVHGDKKLYAELLVTFKLRRNSGRSKGLFFLEDIAT
jgi:hypothetical protein